MTLRDDVIAMSKMRREALETSCMPIIRVLNRAFLEHCNNELKRDCLTDYLFEVDKAWFDQSGFDFSSNTFDRFNSFELLDLTDTLREMQKEGVINSEGVIQNPQKLVTGGFLREVRLPWGQEKVNLEETKEFKKMITQKLSKVDVSQREG